MSCAAAQSIRRIGERIAIGSEGTMNTRRGENSRTEPLLLPATGLTPSLRRIGALIERYIFLLRGSGVGELSS